MSIKIISKKSVKKAAIILLMPPYDVLSDNLIKNLTKACGHNKWSVIKVIQIRGSADASALYKLTRKVASCTNKPVNVIFDKEFSNFPLNILTLCSLGILQESKLITLHTYDSKSSEITLESLKTEKNNFLHKAAIYFKNLINYDIVDSI
jgi:hypothetical protein